MKVKKVNVEIKSREEVFQEAKEVMKKVMRGEKVEKSEALVFESVDDFRSLITPQRMRLLKLIHKHNPKSIYRLAKIARRDYANVHRDVEILERFDFLERENKKLESCDLIKIEIKV